MSDSRFPASWSVYWYNGLIINSEIARGLDIFELEASDFLTQNEIDAARSVEVNKFNAQRAIHVCLAGQFRQGPCLCRLAGA